MKFQQVYPTLSQMGVMDTYTIITSSSWVAYMSASTLQHRTQPIFSWPHPAIYAYLLRP